MTPTTPAAYHGPQTFREGVSRIEALEAQGIDLRAAVDRITTRMKDAGYAAESKRVEKYFRASLKRYEKSVTRRKP